MVQSTNRPVCAVAGLQYESLVLLNLIPFVFIQKNVYIYYLCIQSAKCRENWIPSIKMHKNH